MNSREWKKKWSNSRQRRDCLPICERVCIVCTQRESMRETEIERKCEQSQLFTNCIVQISINLELCLFRNMVCYDCESECLNAQGVTHTKYLNYLVLLIRMPSLIDSFICTLSMSTLTRHLLKHQHKKLNGSRAYYKLCKCKWMLPQRSS